MFGVLVFSFNIAAHLKKRDMIIFSSFDSK